MYCISVIHYLQAKNTEYNLDEGVKFSQVVMDSLCDVIDICTGKQYPDFVLCVSQVMLIYIVISIIYYLQGQILNAI